MRRRSTDNGRIPPGPAGAAATDPAKGNSVIAPHSYTVSPAPRWVVVLFAVTASVITLTLALGSMVCATDASASCPNWPGCYVGQLIPRPAYQPVLEFVHRVIAASVGLLALAGVVVGVLQRHRSKLLLVLPLVALAGALTSGVFGMMTIKWGINRVEAAFDLLAAIISMGAMWTVWYVARDPDRRWSWGRDAVLGAVAIGCLVASHFGAVLVAGAGSLTRCMGWPMLVRGAGDGPLVGWVVQQGLGVIGVAAAVAVLIRSRQRGRRVRFLLLNVVIVAEVATGIVVATNGATHLLGVIHGVCASAALALLMTGTVDDARH